MKKTLFSVLSIVLLAGLATFSTSCNLEKLTQFYLGPYTTSITIPGTSLGGQVLDNLLSDFVPTNSESSFSGNSTGKDFIEKITLDEMTLKVNTPATGNFNFLKSITISIAADGLPDKEIASKTTIADGLTTIDMDESGENLKDYLTGANFRLKTKVELDGAPTEDTKIDITTKYFVDAQILKK